MFPVMIIKVLNIGYELICRAPFIRFDMKSNLDSVTLPHFQKEGDGCVFIGSLTPPGTDDDANSCIAKPGEMLSNNRRIEATIRTQEGIVIAADVCRWIKTFSLPMEPDLIVIRSAIPGIIECGDGR